MGCSWPLWLNLVTLLRHTLQAALLGHAISGACIKRAGRNRRLHARLNQLHQDEGQPGGGECSQLLQAGRLRICASRLTSLCKRVIAASADQRADLKPTFACLPGAPQVPYVHDKSPKPALWTFQLSYAPLGDFLPMAKASISQWGTGCDLGTESRP